MIVRLLIALGLATLAGGAWLAWRATRPWRQDAVVPSRGQVLAGTLAIFASQAGLLVLAVHTANQGSRDRAAHSAEQRAQLRRQIAAARSEAELAHRLARLERPTDRELTIRVRRIVELIRRRPELRRQLQAAVNAPAPPDASRGDRQPSRRPGPTSAVPAPGHPPSRDTGPRQPDTGAPPATGPPSPPSPPVVNVVPPRTVTTPAGPISLPALPPLCLRPVGGVNC